MQTTAETLNLLNFPSFQTFLLKFLCTYKNRSSKLLSTDDNTAVNVDSVLGEGSRVKLPQAEYYGVM